jgi:hypothetical protein
MRVERKFGTSLTVSAFFARIKKGDFSSVAFVEHLRVAQLELIPYVQRALKLCCENEEPSDCWCLLIENWQIARPEKLCALSSIRGMALSGLHNVTLVEPRRIGI